MFIGLRYTKVVKAKIYKSHYSCRHFSHSIQPICLSHMEYLRVSDSTLMAMLPTLLYQHHHFWHHLHCHHHIPWDGNQQLEDGVVGVRHVVAQDPAPPPVHLIFIHILVHCESSSASFCQFDFTSSHFRSNASAAVTLSSWETQSSKALLVSKVGKSKSSAGWQIQMKMNLDLDLLPHAIPIFPLPSHQHLHYTKL